MTLQQLKYVIAIADSSSMSEAAKSLFISQPTLSNSIKELEREIGIRIFNRTNKGIVISVEGKKFLGYARQVTEQMQLLEEEYLGAKTSKQKFCISMQHYSFAVNAFVNLIQECGTDRYDFTIRETRTYEIIDDVRSLRSEIGILYLNDFNEKVIMKLIRESNLEFEKLFTVKPHIFVSSRNPLSQKDSVTLKELEPYPYLSFDQGDYNSFYFAEEILSTLEHSKNVRVSDRATLFNLLIGLNGYTISTGVISKELNGEVIVSVPLSVDDSMVIGSITLKNASRSRLGEIYMTQLRQFIKLL